MEMENDQSTSKALAKLTLKDKVGCSSCEELMKIIIQQRQELELYKRTVPDVDAHLQEIILKRIQIEMAKTMN